MSPADYRGSVLPHSAAVFDSIADLRVPRIHFGVCTGEILTDMASPDVEVVGVDWRVPLDRAAQRIRPGQAVQGNLDPTSLLGPRHRLFRAAEDVLRRAGGRPGHIFNLGHGILPDTPIAHVEQLIRRVKGES